MSTRRKGVQGFNGTGSAMARFGAVGAVVLVAVAVRHVQIGLWRIIYDIRGKSVEVQQSAIGRHGEMLTGFAGEPQMVRGCSGIQRSKFQAIIVEQIKGQGN